jgi:glycosyltransferase 2 family protein
VTAGSRPVPAPAAPAGGRRPDPDRAAAARRVRRHPGDVVRVAVGAAVVVAAAAVHAGRAGRLEADVVRLVDDLPMGLLRPLAALLQLGALPAVAAVALAVLAARRVRLARDLAAAGTLAWLLAKLVEALVDGVRPAGVPASGLGFPSSHVAVAAALATVAAPYLPRPARRAAWAMVVLVGVAGVYDSGLLAADVLAAAALGWAAAGALHLLLGAPSVAPTTDQVASALRRVDVGPVEVGRADGDARGSVPFVVRDGRGERLFVKAVGREQRDADLLYKLWRWAVFREVEDETPFASAKQQAEHEAYLSLLASRAGVRTPEVLTATPAADGQVLLVQQYVAGRTLDRLDAAQADDRLLAAVWAEVGRLRAAGIAHRDLRRANLLVDAGGQPWLLDFGFAEAAASARRLAGDVAELLASLACLVGPDRAVRGATRALGAEAVAQALPLLQPAALAAATRADLKARPGLLAELRERAATAAGTEPPPLEPLTRVRPSTLLLLAAGGFAVHLLLPQVGELRQTLDALRTARWAWLLVGLALAAASYLAAAVAQLGAVDPPLGLGRTTLVQVASSFANRLTPASLGGIGLNIRFLEQAGLDRPAAAAAVAVNTAAGVLVHVLGLVVAALLIGRARVGAAHIPRGWPLLVALAVALAAGGLALWSPLGLHRLVTPVLRAGRELGGVLRRPAKAAQLLGGSAGVTLAYALALAGCLAAFEAHLSLASAVAVYLAAAAVAAASPTPGGLGAMEAALVAGLTAVGAPAGPAVAGVLAFRLLTFWLPILPGWLAYRALRADGTI